ncbi:NAD-dependent histone deacetylase sir2 [Orbilia oligospora]|uniref:NAD-dependent histone deacetylase sir2 n=1 Tax=Orbilia oligospora TaxID=2813651 RepID=A0A7C8JK52_ORBOL|nr:NAD-dependent histone deacetylase sir2 [Orbilia oligospora]KAF3091844.1 NAD-dependent histone deacetylase sir2 [Orbilia oligospora]KAF3110504.1 NAD-dependent histone deacetylase sir2 [Orbilia oligospora]
MSRQRIVQAKSLILFYGAGVSTAAGVEPVRKGDDTESSRKWDWNIALGPGSTGPEEWLKWAASQQRESFKWQPTKFHRWLNLEKSGRIKAIFSMNLDGLEIKSGLIPNPIAPHGREATQTQGYWRQMICRSSKKRHHRRPATKHDEQILSNGICPPCLNCEIETPEEARAKVMRPGILLDNDQELSIDMFPILSTLRNRYKDGREVDMLLVIGTSISHSSQNTVAQLKKLARHAIYVDPSPTRTDIFDDVLKMTADELAELLGYSDLVNANEVLLS